MVANSSTHSLLNIRWMDATSDECLSELRSLLRCQTKITAARNLQGNEALTFVDFLDQVLARSSLDDKFQQRCLLLLSKICKARGILPTSYFLREEIHNGQIHYCGGFADVIKGEYSGSPVAIKRLRVGQGDYSRVFKWLCREAIGWKRLTHPNILPLLGISIVPDNNRLDILTEWMPSGNIMEYTKSNPEANRLRLLSEVTSAVAYLHRLKIVHGDLKGKNVLVDNTAAARISDFGLMTMADSGTNVFSQSSISSSGTHRWMSPELLYPENFGSDGRKTRESDCYALGMLIYEVLSGHPPFYHMRTLSAVIAVVIDGQRPERPPNAESLGFSDAIWGLLQLCWSESSSTRPTAEQLFDELSSAADTWVPPSVYPVEAVTNNDIASADSTGLSRIMMSSTN
ncbi:kinase-like domain-containing protein [Thelephora terrestris]|uniref:Kinase-like domain-containing protein n=1 Tax=Thelephora terrestris TaxID=56493 RepID=A0A9P6H625_9AGAM|nr:kinase-like domain-containing protein [Thelephora terrestris]